LGSGGSILFGWKVMAAEVKEVVEPFVGGQETLCLSDYSRDPQIAHHAGQIVIRSISSSVISSPVRS
jgi:hypothetical protein